jgi:pimeloyl-ACP methyl ester carboxylesterase
MPTSRRDVRIDVGAALPTAPSGVLEVAATVIFDPTALAEDPQVIVAVPGGTYHRRYWDLQPPGRSGYSQAQWHARRGGIFIACDYLGGGDGTRPDDGDFMTLEVCADAAHAVYQQIREGLQKGTLVAELPALAIPRMVGIGQSLGGFITMMQQGKYGDYPGIAVFGASPILIANIPAHRRLDGLSQDERRAAIMADNAAASGVGQLPIYHGAPRENFRGIFHVLDIPADLFQYDVDHCQSLISRVSGTDGMTPGISKEFADHIEVPVFLAFGEIDVSADPHAEPTGYPASPDATVVVMPNMAHMHNFADTREQLWRRFDQWLPVVI